MANVGYRQLGEIPAQPRAIIRSARNPIDISTIVSVFPMKIEERKYTIEPGMFIIPAGTEEKPGILKVGSSSWWKNFDENQPTLEIPVSSVAVANSVIGDYCRGMLGCDMADCKPGLFFVLGEVDEFQIKTKYESKLKEAVEKQNNWYKVLVRIADSLWARANGNPLTISDEMRIAARALNYDDKPWILDYRIVEMSKCYACGSLKNPAFPVCPTCRAIDPSNPLAKDIKFAG